MRQLAEVAVAIKELSDDDNINNNSLIVKKLLNKIKDGMDTVTLDSYKSLFDKLDAAYDGNNPKFKIIPLPINLVYADDNYGNTTENERYIKQMERMLRNIKRIIRFFKNRTFKKPNREIMKKIIKEIDLFDEYLDRKAKNNEWLISNKDYQKQIDDHGKLALANKRIKPFLAIDPRMQRNLVNPKDNYLYDYVASYFDNIPANERQFYGIKLYAPIGFSPTDPILVGDENNKSIYKYCIDNDIPITVHNSNSGFSCFSNDLDVSGWVYYREKRRKNYKLIQCDNRRIKFRKKFFSISLNKAIMERAKVL
ncbi:MAG: hypothetical protein C0597_03080, partial [Marinilabiliales bacterium]